MEKTIATLPNSVPTLEARFESLSIGQLKGRLQLTEAIHHQLMTSGTVTRCQIQVAIESVGIELPSTVPETSFTQYPSKQNHEFMLDLLKNERDALSRQMSHCLTTQLIASLNSIVRHIRVPSPMCETPHQILQVLGKHWENFDLSTIPDDHPSELVQSELKSIRMAMSKWLDLGRFGMEATCQHNYRFPEAQSILEQIQTLLHSQFKDKTNWEQLHGRLMKFQNDCYLADGCDYTEGWTPAGLMNHISEFLLDFKEPPVYCLSPYVPAIEQYVNFLETSSEAFSQHDNEFALYASGLIESFLTWCWRIDNARAVAVDCAIQMSRAVSHLRSLTA
jgi:hypothetical protein